MRILLINYEYPPIGAGAATATYHIARCLAEQHHDVFVLTSCFGKLRNWRIENNVNVFRCPAFRKKAGQSNIFEMVTFIFSSFLLLPFLLQKNKIDVSIVFFSLPCGPLGLLGKFVSGVPYVVSLRGGDVPGNEPSLERLHTFFKPLRRLIFKKSLAIVANSEGLKKLSGKADPYPVKVISNGVDTKFFIPAVKKDMRKRLLFVGRFQDQKNLFFLLMHIDKVAQQVKEKFELHLVGEGPLGDMLKNYANTLSMHDRIFWHGWCGKNELRQYYQQAVCILNPSLCEGMPNVVLEAMACGLPAIASDVAGNEAVVRHGETGFLFDLQFPELFRKAAVKILEDSDLAVQMGLRGREWVEREFSWDKVAEKYIKLLEGK